MLAKEGSPNVGAAASEDAPISRADNYAPAVFLAPAGPIPNP
jgi:hypothetical protein